MISSGCSIMGTASVVLTTALVNFAIFIQTVDSIVCYQCISTDQTNPFQCNEYMNEDIDIIPESCENVFGASYCIKHIGRFEVEAILCYQCMANYNIDCGDPLIHDTDGRTVQSTSCDHVFEARYCIKTTGLHGGGLGTKRFCSSLDLGNYCNYIQQPGDELEYRSCVFTCSSDGCNSSRQLRPLGPFVVLLLTAIFACL